MSNEESRTVQPAEQVDFEQALQRLEEIVRGMEGANVKLADSLALFEEGVRLTALCNKLLDTAEQKVNMLMQNEDGDMVPAPMPEV